MIIVTVIAWISIIFMLSSQSYQEQSIQPTLHRLLPEHIAKAMLPDVAFSYHGIYYSSKNNPYQFIEFLFRKGAHLFMYAILAVAGALAIKVKDKLARRWPLPLILVVMIAALDELNQRITEGRTSNAQDVLVDLTGGCIGLLVYLAVSYVYRRHKASRSVHQMK
ncbi:VanZ family protein [Paenibacillus silvisoli]|uniref:VanZ family protein n=1 Tax=Paenibacillus silvisoli TaxID=3110539 RepID=UPI0028050AF5|nr:VanZ family protein [Paenibacillus silvisoli]